MTPREAGDYGGRLEPPQNEVRRMFNRNALWTAGYNL
jgi:hypothetical protein